MSVMIFRYRHRLGDFRLRFEQQKQCAAEAGRLGEGLRSERRIQERAIAGNFSGIHVGEIPEAHRPVRELASRARGFKQCSDATVPWIFRDLRA